MISPVSGPDARLVAGLRPLLVDVGEYWRVLPAQRLRGYQLRPGRAIAESIMKRRGMQFAVVFSRQAGKDEMLAQLLAWLLTRYQAAGGNAVVVAPTITQAYVSGDRMLGRLRGSTLTVGGRRRGSYAN